MERVKRFFFKAIPCEGVSPFKSMLRAPRSTGCARLRGKHDRKNFVQCRYGGLRSDRQGDINNTESWPWQR